MKSWKTCITTSFADIVLENITQTQFFMQFSRPQQKLGQVNNYYKHFSRLFLKTQKLYECQRCMKNFNLMMPLCITDLKVTSMITFLQNNSMITALQHVTMKNTVISPNFYTSKLGEITVFFVLCAFLIVEAISFSGSHYMM